MNVNTGNTNQSNEVVNIYNQCKKLSEQIISKIQTKEFANGESHYLNFLRNTLLAYNRFGRAIFMLLNKDDVYTSLIILRVVFELHVLHLYIRIDKRNRSKNYNEFVELDYIRLFEAIKEINLNYRSEELKAVLDQMVEGTGLTLIEYREKNGKLRKKWSKNNTKQWCNDVDSYFGNEKYKLSDLYDTLYDYLSGYAHSGPSALLGGKFNNNLLLQTLDVRTIVNKYFSFSYDLYKIINEEFGLEFQNELSKYEMELVDYGARVKII